MNHAAHNSIVNFIWVIAEDGCAMSTCAASTARGTWMKPTDTTTPQKKNIIIAGPNGAGKTTFAEEFLPKEAGCSTFVNADLIAAGLAPFEPERAAFRAGRLMLEEIYHHARRGESFAFETTLSGRG